MPCTKKSTKQFHCHSNESSLWPCLDSKYHPSGRLGPTSNFSFTFHWLLNKRLENKENEHWPQEKEAWSHEQNFLLQNHWQHNRRIKNSVESTNRFNLSWKGFKIIFFYSHFKWYICILIKYARNAKCFGKTGNKNNVQLACNIAAKRIEEWCCALKHSRSHLLKTWFIARQVWGRWENAQHGYLTRFAEMLQDNLHVFCCLFYPNFIIQCDSN